MSLLSNAIAVPLVHTNAIFFGRGETIQMMSFVRFMELIALIFQIQNCSEKNNSKIELA